MAKICIILNACLLLCMTDGGLHAQKKILQVTDELPCTTSPTVFIGNVIRRVTVRSTPENKVRLVTTVAYEGNCGFTNEQWLNKLELKVSGTADDIQVKCGNMEPMNYDDGRSFEPSPIPFSSSRAQAHRVPELPQRRTLNNLTPNGTVIFDADGHWLRKDGNIRRDIIVYLPAGAKLQIDSRYAEIILDSSVGELKARITNGGLTMKDAGRLILTSAYGSIYTGNIRDAEIELNHGWFHAKNISSLDITSKVSTVELGVAGRLKINSNDDQYDLEKAAMIYGGKNYGSIRVDTLSGSLDLTGVNADIKVHDIEPGVSFVHIDGQYADLRLPVDNLKDYTVNFEGTGSNLYTPFEKTHVTDSSFTTVVGTGKKNAFRLKCSNCTLDMK